MKNLTLTPADIDTIPPGSYTATIQFVVDSLGRISAVLIRNDPGYGLGKRAMDVVARYNGHWRWTSSANGRRAKNYKAQPITFIIGDEGKKQECEEQQPPDFIP